jgi:hypothetical protein
VAPRRLSADLKLDVPSDVEWGIFQSFAPYFNLKASTAKKADANSLNFGAQVAAPFNISRKIDPATDRPRLPDRRLLTGVVWKLGGGFESDRRFHNINILSTNKVVFVPRGIGDSNTVYFQPFVGLELGRNLKSPLAEARNRGLARATVGGSLYIRKRCLGSRFRLIM